MYGLASLLHCQSMCRWNHFIRQLACVAIANAVDKGPGNCLVCNFAGQNLVTWHTLIDTLSKTDLQFHNVISYF